MPAGAVRSSALTKADFIKQADSICQEANSAIASLSAGANIDADRPGVAGARHHPQRAAVAPVPDAPSEDASTLKDFLAAMKNEVDALTSLSSAAASGGDTSTADAELAGARSNAQSAATSYGFQDCGNAQSRRDQPGAPRPPRPCRRPRFRSRRRPRRP